MATTITCCIHKCGAVYDAIKYPKCPKCGYLEIYADNGEATWYKDFLNKFLELTGERFFD